MNKDVAVNIFLFDPARRSLLLQLRDDNPAIANPNVWCLPGGGAEACDATAKDAARRELWEEAGYDALHLEEMGQDEFGGLHRYFFAARYDGRQPISKGEGSRMEFVPLLALPENVWIGHLEWIRTLATLFMKH